jgi:hypothetical protein
MVKTSHGRSLSGFLSRIVRSGMRFPMSSRVGLVAVALLVAALATVRSQAPGPVRSPQDTILFRIIVVESAEAARRVLDQLAAGDNFVALAQKVSVDPTGRTGGLVGPVPTPSARPSSTGRGSWWPISRATLTRPPNWGDLVGTTLKTR